MSKESFRLRLKEKTEDNREDSFIVYKRKRKSGTYIPTSQTKQARKKLTDDVPYFDLIPDEMCLRIYFFLSAKELCRGPSQVSKRLHILSDNAILWKELLLSELPDIPVFHGTPKTNWKSFFIKLYKKKIAHCSILLKNSRQSMIDK